MKVSFLLRVYVTSRNNPDRSQVNFLKKNNGPETFAYNLSILTTNIKCILRK